MFSRSTKLITSCIAALLVIFGGALICHPSYGINRDDEPFSDAKLDKLYDWVVYLDVNELRGYLNYPGSRLRPLSQVRISCRNAARIGSRSPVAMIYEDLWYTNEAAVGCRRFRKLPIGADLQGAIIVRNSDDLMRQTSAVANALLRMILDLSLRDDAVSTVIVPAEVYDQVAADLGHFGFFPEPADVMDDQHQQISISMISNPKGRLGDFYFTTTP